MKSIVYYLETGSHDPSYNLAFEEYVMAHRKNGDYLLLWQNDNTVVIGQNQNIEAEINRDFVNNHGIHVIRRMTGGGAVYHDLGNLNYSFITDAGDVTNLTMARFTDPVVEALRGLGLAAEASGRNDILIDGYKVSGTAQRKAEGRILHHGTLLFDSNLDMMSGALQADPEKFCSKGIRSVRGRVRNIRDFLRSDMTLDEFWNYLKIALTGDGFVTVTMSEEELTQIQTLKSNKYETWEWNVGASPKYEMKERRRFAGGTLEVQMTVKDGYIEGIAFCGDFLSLRPSNEVSQALIGCPLQRKSVSAALVNLSIEQYFGTITVEEVLQTIFNIHV